MRPIQGILLVALLTFVAGGGLAGPAAKKGPPEVSPELRAALEKLKLPGVKINLEEWCVDVESSVCLESGTLELIACIKDSKEHESVVVVEAKPSHIHTALLLIGARAGNPAMRKPIDKEGMRFVDLPPRGGAIDVFLVLKDETGKEVEKPISAFLTRAEHYSGRPQDDEEEQDFPTHTFLFAGSILHGGEGEKPRIYVCDRSGNVISISTFGDELLCLPGIHAHANGALMWEIKPDSLPKVGTKVTLRLRPKMKEEGKSSPR